MKPKEHYSITKRSEENKTLAISVFSALFLLCSFIYLFITGESGYVYPGVKNNSGDIIWPVFALFVFGICFFIFCFFLILWEKRHSEDHVYIDIGWQGISFDPEPSSKQLKPIFYPWEEIEYCDLCFAWNCYYLDIKPHHKPRVRVELPSVNGLRKALRVFSKRKDIIRILHVRPFS